MCIYAGVLYAYVAFSPPLLAVICCWYVLSTVMQEPSAGVVPTNVGGVKPGGMVIS